MFSPIRLAGWWAGVGLSSGLETVRDLKPEDPVFIDETGLNLAMVLAYARAQRGCRAYAPQPKAQGKNTSLIGAMTLKDEFLDGLSFTGGTTGDLFLWFY